MDSLGFRRLHAFKRLILQHLEHLGLNRPRHLADLVEDQCAAVALFENTDPSLVDEVTRPTPSNVLVVRLAAVAR